MFDKKKSSINDTLWRRYKTHHVHYFRAESVECFALISPLTNKAIFQGQPWTVFYLHKLLHMWLTCTLAVINNVFTDNFYLCYVIVQ